VKNGGSSLRQVQVQLQRGEGAVQEGEREGRGERKRAEQQTDEVLFHGTRRPTQGERCEREETADGERTGEGG
jgi:hypothetical protein